MSNAVDNAQQSYGRMIWQRTRHDRFAMSGLVVIVLLIAIAYFAPLIANNKPIAMRYDGRLLVPAVAELFPLNLVVKYPQLRSIDFSERRDSGEGGWLPMIPYSPYETSLRDKLEGPNRRHWFGTDELGRDVAARMVYGARVSLSVGVVAMSIALLIGVIAGALAGFYGGIVDVVVSRTIEVVMSFPMLFLILAVIAFLPASIYNIMVVIGLTRWTAIARYTRGEFIRLKKQEFTDAARALGASDRKIIFRHILPNSLAPVLVAATFGIANAILLEAALSFLGMGVQPPTPSWGAILALARDYIDVAWWLAVAPGVAIFITVTAFNVFGEGLRDASDPRISS